jgi:hypothetical protein
MSSIRHARRDFLIVRIEDMQGHLEDLYAEAVQVEGRLAEIHKEIARCTSTLAEVRAELLSLYRDDIQATLVDRPDQSEDLEPELARIETAIAAALAAGEKVSLPPRIRGRQRRMSGIAAVRAVLQEGPGEQWRPRDVHDVLVKRGWVSGAESGASLTESALYRLWQRGEVERVSRGVYRWKGNSAQ